MPDRSTGSMITVTLAAAAVAALSLPLAMAQTPVRSGAAQDSTVKTPWGEPDLQGIWTDETDTPLQRPPKYANQEFFTAAQREQLDRERSALLRRDKRVERGTELDVAPALPAPVAEPIIAPAEAPVVMPSATLPEAAA